MSHLYARNSDASFGFDQDIINVKMKLWDSLPNCDRAYFPISEIKDIIPKLLFEGKDYAISKYANDIDLFSYNSVCLPHSNQYAYCVGMLYYERLKDANAAAEKWRMRDNLKKGEEEHKLNYKNETKLEDKEESKNKNKVSLRLLFYRPLKIIKKS